MIVIFRFKIYENIVLNEYKELYQLEHFKRKYTYPFKKLTYNKDRKAYRIYSQWVSLKRLNKLSYKVNEKIQVGVLNNLSYLLLQIKQNTPD
tara:strand:- start:822 stop:1097 length:276 start_codon:yes stop_codon:yes gene_type:complete